MNKKEKKKFGFSKQQVKRLPDEAASFTSDKPEINFLQTLQTWFLCHRSHAPNKNQQKVSKYLIG